MTNGDECACADKNDTVRQCRGQGVQSLQTWEALANNDNELAFLKEILQLYVTTGPGNLRNSRGN